MSDHSLTSTDLSPTPEVESLNAVKSLSVNVEETKRKLHFLPASTANISRRQEKLTLLASVDVKHGVLSIHKDSVLSLSLDKFLIKIYYDQGNKVIGWKIKNRLSQGELQSKEWKKPAIAKQSGRAVIGIRKILKQMHGLTKTSYNSLEIKKYKDPDAGMLGDNDWIYYIELK